jgi:hypothetical protein
MMTMMVTYNDYDGDELQRMTITMAIVMATDGKDVAKWFTFVSSVAMAC